ncbi:MAG TPA: hypothetical protein VFT65_06915 [Candidatus Angelobacter sp.]|nr:hypothetical protein [Candidatus Angelobacter sp.]
MSKEQVAALLARTEKLAARGQYELFKPQPISIQPAHHPKWLGQQSPRVDQLAGPPN